MQKVALYTSGVIFAAGAVGHLKPKVAAVGPAHVELNRRTGVTRGLPIEGEGHPQDRGPSDENPNLPPGRYVTKPFEEAPLLKEVRLALDEGQ